MSKEKKGVNFKFVQLYNNFKNIDPISERIVTSLINLFDAGLNHLTFDVVGFSIGAQFAGYVGRKIRKRSEKILQRIVGLEPGIASPENLSSSDATFVMTIHTGNVFGETNVIGHVGFYPNGNSQPMCKRKLIFMNFDDPICNHGQAQFYWIEAVKTKSAILFPARKCDSFNEFVEKRCSKKVPIGYMNTKTSAALKGKYYLVTNSVSPFSKVEP